MSKKPSSLLKEHKIKPGAQVPLHVTNKMLRALGPKDKSVLQKTYEAMPLDEKIKTAKGKRKPKKLVG